MELMTSLQAISVVLWLLMNEPVISGQLLPIDIASGNETTIKPENVSFQERMILQHSRQPDVGTVSIRGLREATRECQRQMLTERWGCDVCGYHRRQQTAYGGVMEKEKLDNCTVLDPLPILRNGIKESAYWLAISSASVVSSITRSCLTGELANCACNLEFPPNSSEQAQWKWKGCSKIGYSMNIASELLRYKRDEQTTKANMLQTFYWHNLKAGRLAIAKTRIRVCKCHGVFGSCSMKTCWEIPARLSLVGFNLKHKYFKSKSVNLISDDEYFENTTKRGQQTEILDEDLVHFEESPSYCNWDENLMTPGTQGRICTLHNLGQINLLGNCENMCCGRGYQEIVKNVTTPCECVFKYCCQVVCKRCHQTVRVTKCK